VLFIVNEINTRRKHWAWSRARDLGLWC